MADCLDPVVEIVAHPGKFTAQFPAQAVNLVGCHDGYFGALRCLPCGAQPCKLFRQGIDTLADASDILAGIAWHVLSDRPLRRCGAKLPFVAAIIAICLGRGCRTPWRFRIVANGTLIVRRNLAPLELALYRVDRIAAGPCGRMRRAGFRFVAELFQL